MMTDLDALEAAALKAKDSFRDDDWDEWHIQAQPVVVLALISEVRRLRQALASLQKGLEVSRDDVVAEINGVRMGGAPQSWFDALLSNDPCRTPGAGMTTQQPRTEMAKAFMLALEDEEVDMEALQRTLAAIEAEAAAPLRALAQEIADWPTDAVTTFLSEPGLLWDLHDRARAALAATEEK